MRACLTIDVEQDCPPYLDTWRGMSEGLPWLLDTLGRHGVTATFFVTGEAARRFPDAIRRISAEGHELGCHGDTHHRYSRLTMDDAARDLDRACTTLRAFAPVTSFRAPNVDLPPACLPLIEAAAFIVDSSIARYKHPGAQLHQHGRLTRLPVSITSSALRLPLIVRQTLLHALDDPAVVFVHPWEFVDLRRAPIRWDCRVRTGVAAREAFESTITTFASRGARFSLVRDCVLL